MKAKKNPVGRPKKKNPVGRPKKKNPVGRPKLPDHLVKKKRYIRMSDNDLDIIYETSGWTLQEFVDKYMLDLSKHNNQLKKMGLL